MQILELLYKTGLGRLLSKVVRIFAVLHRPFMVYGFVDPDTKAFRKWTRMGSTVTIMNRARLTVGDHVWVSHYSILDATEGLCIGEGCQIGAWVGIFTHGSENAIRLLGRKFIDTPNAERAGYTRGKVSIGAYTYIGARSIVLPGVQIGKGCLIGAGSIVNKNIPDFSIITENSGIKQARTVDLDRRFFKTRDYSETYYDPDALAEIKKKME